jgi:hypothetical protein
MLRAILVTLALVAATNVALAAQVLSIEPDFGASVMLPSLPCIPSLPFPSLPAFGGTPSCCSKRIGSVMILTLKTAGGNACLSAFVHHDLRGLDCRLCRRRHNRPRHRRWILPRLGRHHDRILWEQPVQDGTVRGTPVTL